MVKDNVSDGTILLSEKHIHFWDDGWLVHAALSMFQSLPMKIIDLLQDKNDLSRWILDVLNI